MSKKTLTRLAVCLAFTCCLPAVAAQSSRVDILSASGAAGAVVQVPIYLESTGGAQPTGLQVDVGFNTAVLSYNNQVSAGAAAQAASKSVSANVISGGTLRIIVAGFNQNAIANGIVALAEFRIASGAAVSTTPLVASAVRVTNAQAQTIASTTGNGLILIGGGVSSPSELFFPQIADGGGFITSVILTNPGSSAATGILELFKTEGTALIFNLNGNFDNAFAVTLPAKGVLILESAGTNPTPQSGWARIRSSAAVGGSIIYSYGSSGTVVSEAGINPSSPAGSFSLSVDTRRGFMAGVAAANPNPGPITLTLTLYSAGGTQLGQRTRSLAALNQFAELVDQLFPGVNPSSLVNFTGLITVAATGGQMVGTTLRFSPDLSVFSSIPVN